MVDGQMFLSETKLKKIGEVLDLDNSNFQPELLEDFAEHMEDTDRSVVTGISLGLARFRNSLNPLILEICYRSDKGW